MNIAYILSDEHGGNDAVLSTAAEQLQRRGLRVAGLVQTNTGGEGNGHCDMDVRVLPDGPVIRISQSLGIGAKGCRLDPGALERAVAEIGGAMREPVDLLILNKFGKVEADGKGLRLVIAEAYGQDIPMVIGVNSGTQDAFMEYVGGEATRIPSEVEAIVAWLTEQLARAPGAGG